MPGFSEMCVGGHHPDCHDSDCRCLCHNSVKEMLREAKKPMVAPGTLLVCPICSQRPRAGDLFCRFDGETLVSPKKCECGQIGDQSDRFCGKCGRRFGAAPEKIPELSEEEIKALEQKARSRPSDVEVAPQEVH